RCNRCAASDRGRRARHHAHADRAPYTASCRVTGLTQPPVIATEYIPGRSGLTATLGAKVCRLFAIALLGERGVAYKLCWAESVGFFRTSRISTAGHFGNWGGKL